MKLIVNFFIVLCLHIIPIEIESHKLAHLSSYPIIAGDTFRNFCDFVLDKDSNFLPDQVKRGNTIMVRIGLLDTFFAEYHPKIKFPYILITHNISNDSIASMPGKYKPLLDDPKLFAWFTKNIGDTHPKLYPLPLGLANQEFQHGNSKMIYEYARKYYDAPRSGLLYMNFTINTYPQERQSVFDLFSKQPFCSIGKPKNFKDYIEELVKYKFVLSPRGGAVDCHRTWEAMLVGTIPVVLTSTLDCLFDDLPIVIVQDWREVTQEFLERKYNEMLNTVHNVDKLYAEYWFNLIREQQRRARADK